MSKIKPSRLELSQGENYWFWCPGCDCAHDFIVNREAHPVWVWNGDLERPTVNPSLLINIPGNRCHSFIRDGNIQFLSDCDHALAGQTVPIPDWPFEN